MSIDIATVERLMWMYWQPDKSRREEVRLLAADILNIAKRGSSLGKFKSELGKIQVSRLHQTLNVMECDEIAIRVFAGAHA